MWYDIGAPCHPPQRLRPFPLRYVPLALDSAALQTPKTLPPARRGTCHEDRIAPQAPTIQTSRKPPLSPPHKQHRASPVTVL